MPPPWFDPGIALGMATMAHRTISHPGTLSPRANPARLASRIAQSGPLALVRSALACTKRCMMPFFMLRFNCKGDSGEGQRRSRGVHRVEASLAGGGRARIWLYFGDDSIAHHRGAHAGRSPLWQRVPAVMGIPERGARIATRRTREVPRHQIREFSLSFVLSPCIG